jgi:type 1 glutamine amidotransferase
VAAPINVYLVAGGKYHDIDFARLELLQLLSEHERLRVSVGADYSDSQAIGEADVLMTYTCDVVPVDGEIAGLERFLNRGRRWVALHGTNSVLKFRADKRVECPPLDDAFLDMVGSQFQAHPTPIGRYKVTRTADEHPLVAEIDTFVVEDEQYLQDYRPGNRPLLVTRFAGATETFVRDEWPDAEHMVMYLRETGGGEVLYFTLGHARGRFDLRPLAAFYPFVERGAWQLPVYHDILRRSILWSMDR